ncbi:50S ribosomal protein L29 [Candidatus Nanohalovita haloferacivicina]|uniref:50S ribosomal protein L29 n=1 Tax=Candidatus Nanohalovita haloferacivicina TaxID=2978046 RepID=UPI00325FA514|nr:Ribosomal protein L29 [Candidatus Nanohalobia archaeon BNXNv]
MSELSISELREKDADELKQDLTDLQKELVQERGQIEVGGFADNPGRLGEMKKTIARIKTVLNERQ